MKMNKSCKIAFILTLIVLAIWAYEPHAFSVSDIWTVRGTGAES